MTASTWCSAEGMYFSTVCKSEGLFTDKGERSGEGGEGIEGVVELGKRADRREKGNGKEAN